MKINPLAIASRTLLLRQNGLEAVVRVEMGPIEKKDDAFACHIRIGGNESELNHDIYGIDSIQALQLALKIAGSELNRVAEEQSYFIEGSSEPGHGFEDILSNHQGRI